MKTQDQSELVKYGIETCAYMLARNQRITSKEFAALIRAQVDNPQSRAVADAFEATPAIIERRWNGTTISGLCAENKDEITARNAGFELAVLPSGAESGKYYVSAKLSGAGQPATGTFDTPAQAWQAAAQHAVVQAESAAAADLVLQRRSERARELGYLASQENRSRAPAADKGFMELLRDAGDGYSIKLLESFSHGFQSRCDEEAALILARPERDPNALPPRFHLRVNGHDLCEGDATTIALMHNNLSKANFGDAPRANYENYLHLLGRQFLGNENAIREGMSLEIAAEDGMILRTNTVGNGALLIAADLLQQSAVAPGDTFAATLYGTINAEASDITIIEGLGVVVGARYPADDGSCEFVVQVTPEAMEQLDPYWGTFMWELHPIGPLVSEDLPHQAVKPLRDLSDNEVMAYHAYLRFHAERPESGNATVFESECANLSAERQSRKNRRAPRGPAAAHSIEI